MPVDPWRAAPDGDDPPGAGRRRALRDVRRADRRGAPARGRPGEPGADVHLPRLLPAVHRRAGRAALPGGARPLPVVPRASPSTRRQWDELQIPVGLAFLFPNSVLDRVVAFYPGPAGATESELPLDAWTGSSRATRSSAQLRPDVEALLIRGEDRGGNEFSCYLVPIDACYELVGRLRLLWRGFDGGAEARQAIDEFFARWRPRRSPHRALSSSKGRHDHLTFTVLDIVAEPYAAAPQLTARLRIEESTGAVDPRHRAALPGAHRAAAPAATARPTRPGCSACSATGAAGRTPSGRSRGCSAPPWCRASPERPRSTCPCRAPTTSRSPGRGTCTPYGDGTSRWPAVLRHRLHPGQSRVRRRAGAVGLRGALPAAGRGLAADDRAVLSRHRLVAAGPRRAAPRSPRYQAPARTDQLGRDGRTDSCVAAGGARRPGTS